MSITMNEMMAIGLETLNKYCSVKEGNTYNYGRIKLNALLKFNVQRYDLEGIGNLSIMTMNMGIMKMATFIITPYLVDLPMLSTDFMYIASKRKTYLETYDLTSNKHTKEYQNILSQLQAVLDQCNELKDFEHKPGWYEDLKSVDAYKESNKKLDEVIKNTFIDLLTTYVSLAKGQELDEEQRRAKWQIIQQYCNDMASKGGAATDNFNKYKGNEFTLDFFNKVLFGTENYK